MSSINFSTHKIDFLGKNVFIAATASVFGKVSIGDRSSVWFGAVIRGETPHFDYICSSVSNQIGSLSAISGMPVIFGIITTNTIDQALDRAGGKAGNKGSEAALAAIEMTNLLCMIKSYNSYKV